MRNFLSFALILGTALAPAAAARVEDRPRVTVDSGQLAGTREGDTVAFRGVPFAAAPVGPLRWKAPQAPQPWQGARDASKFGAACPQPDWVGAWAQVGRKDEDCLFLNVWRPQRAGKYPVMVFIHGGAFSLGAAGVPLYDGAALAARGAVIVTINYRLGRLGFFAHPALTAENSDGLLGNYGIMDQIAALQWVQRNIGQFGGDRGNVTVFGESAGAGSVQILMGTPATKGLFHKAISQSGAGNSVLPPIRGGAASAEAMGAAWTDSLGLKSATPEQLRAISIADILKDGRGFPFIDGKIVTRSPGDYFYSRTAARIPMMIGFNSDEASLGFNEAVAKGVLGEDFAGLHAAYIGRTGRDPARAAVELAAEVAFALPSFAVADWHAAAGNRTYAYIFDKVSVDQRAKSAGAGHGGEMDYLFGNRPADQRWDAIDTRVSKQMGDYWVRFARTGNPNGGGAQNWPAVSAAPTTYLHIGDKMRVERLSADRERVKAASMAAALKVWAAAAKP